MHDLSRPRLRHLLVFASVLLAGAVRVAPADAADFFVLSPALVNAPCPPERSFVTLQALLMPPQEPATFPIRSISSATCIHPSAPAQ